jgi:hypothetical protein
MTETSTNSSATVATIRWCLVVGFVAVVVSLLEGCGSKGGTTGESSLTVDISSSPRTESPATESPQSGGRNGTSISIASLPVGGTAVSADGVHQCATVVWNGPPDKIPDGSRITLKVRVEPATFRESDTGCSPGGAPKCASYTFTSEQPGPCDVGLESIGQPSVDATLYLDGACSGGSSCTDLLHAVAEGNQNNSPQGIPITGQETTDTSSTTDSTASTAGG